MSEHNIKRSVTIYSWHRQVETGMMTWEDCIKAAVKMGCNGIELLGQLYFRYCPEALKEDIDKWEEMMFKYGTKTICHDFFVDMTMYNHRRLTTREAVDIVRRHALFSKSINCPIMRLGGTVSPEVFKQSVPILEDLGVKMGLEIHNGSSSFVLPNVQGIIDVIQQSGSKYIGIVPDMSIFSLKMSNRQLNSAIANGVPEDFVNMIAETYTKVPNSEFRQICDGYLNASKDDATRSFLAMARRVEYFDPKILLEHMPYIVHCHGKFYEMDENNEETTLDYPGILSALKEGGYQGYISAEYEGAPINGDTFEPFRRYEKMLDKYLGTYPEGNYSEWPDARPAPFKGNFGGPSDNLCPEGFKNHYDENGNCDGFQVNVANYYYRGVPLALFESAHVEVDGVIYGPDKMRVAVDGEVFKFEDMCDVTLHYWNKGTHATLIVDKPGGLAAGKHQVAATTVVRAYYMREGIAGQLTDKALKMPPCVEMELEEA
ncbi:MAG: sugar phosphate isomerase/epimerase [Oscillospiraceae bacterium]|nr:sugar phosphate isomerase/epimerase [Oscillospiraceae bacterium]